MSLSGGKGDEKNKLKLGDMIFIDFFPLPDRTVSDDEQDTKGHTSWVGMIDDWPSKFAL